MRFIRTMHSHAEHGNEETDYLGRYVREREGLILPTLTKSRYPGIPLEPLSHSHTLPSNADRHLIQFTQLVR